MFVPFPVCSLRYDLINEPVCRDCAQGTIASWVKTMAAYIKSLDPNHLLTVGEEGFYSSSAASVPANPMHGESEWATTWAHDFVADHADPNIDFAAFHAVRPLQAEQAQHAAAAAAQGDGLPAGVTASVEVTGGGGLGGLKPRKSKLEQEKEAFKAAEAAAGPGAAPAVRRAATAYTGPSLEEAFGGQRKPSLQRWKEEELAAGKAAPAVGAAPAQAAPAPSAFGSDFVRPKSRLEREKEAWLKEVRAGGAKELLLLLKL